MGSGASFQPQADAYDNLAQAAVEGTLSPSSQKPEKKDGPELKAVLEDTSLQQHYRAYVLKSYKEHVKQSPEGQGLGDKALDKLVAVAQTFLQFYLDAADFEKFGDPTLRMMRAETITTKYFSNQGEVKLPWGRVLVETTLWKLDEDKVPSSDVFRAAKSDAYDYLETEVFTHYVADDGPTGYKAGAFALSAARLRKGLSPKHASKEENTLLEQTLMEPARTALFKDYLNQEEGSAGPDLLFLLLELLDLKQMMTAILSSAKAMPEAKFDENSMQAAGMRFIVNRMYKLYDKFLAVGSRLRELFSEAELNSLTGMISARWEDLTPARLDDTVQTTFTAMCEYYVAFKQDPRSIKALKELEEAREERKHEIRAYAAQYESALSAAEAQAGGPPPTPAPAPAPTPQLAKSASVKVVTVAPPAPAMPRTLEKETAELLIVLSNTEMERSFKAHLRKVRRENFLYFWREVEDFKGIPIAQANYIQGRAEKIFEKYVKRGAASEIPVNVQTRVEILGKLFRADIHIYDQASKDAIRCLLPEYVTWQVIRSQPTFAHELREIDFFDELQMKPSTESNKTLPVTFTELLTVPHYNVCFKRFAEAEFCLSAVLFWNEVQDWKQLPPSSLKDSKFRKIFNKFLKATANMPIQVSDQAMAEAEGEFKGKFDTAESEVFMFLKTVLLPKFLESEHFGKLQAVITLEQVSGTLGDDALGGVDVRVAGGIGGETESGKSSDNGAQSGSEKRAEAKGSSPSRRSSRRDKEPGSSGKSKDGKGSSSRRGSSAGQQRRRSSSSGGSGGGGGAAGGGLKRKHSTRGDKPSLVTPELTARFRSSTQQTLQSTTNATTTRRRSLRQASTDPGEISAAAKEGEELGDEQSSQGALGSLSLASNKLRSSVAEPKDALPMSSRKSSQSDFSSDHDALHNTQQTDLLHSGKSLPDEQGEERNSLRNSIGQPVTTVGDEKDGERKRVQSEGTDPSCTDEQCQGVRGSVFRSSSIGPGDLERSSSTSSLSGTSLMTTMSTTKAKMGMLMTGSGAGKSTTLKNMLKDRTALKFFFYFCTARHCEENVLFYLEAEDFKTTPGTGFLVKQARRLYNSYLGPKAKFPVVVPAAVHDEILASLGRPTHALFKAAQAEVYGTMERKVFPAFLDSPQHDAYKQLSRDPTTLLGESIISKLR